MRQPLRSEPPQTEPAARLPEGAASNVPQSVDAATLDLFAGWQKEDATADPVQLQAAEADLAKFMKNLNDARKASGEPLVYR